MWYFFTIFLDVYPYIFLQLMPFKNKTRFSYNKTLFIATGVLFLYFLGFVLFSKTAQSIESLSIYRLITSIILVIITIFLIQEKKTKVFFVFGLIFPYVGLVLVLSNFLARALSFSNIPTFILICCCRLVLCAVSFPIMRYFFKQKLIPAMQIQDEGIWRVAWPIPISLSLIGATMINLRWELDGVTITDLIGWSVLFVCTLAISIYLFKTLKITEEKANLALTEKYSLKLLKLQKEQYQSIGENIEKAKKTRHDLRHHLSILQSFSLKKDFKGLDAYINNLTGSILLDNPIVLCENHTVNALGQSLTSKAAQYQIKLQMDLHIGNNLKIKDTDICIVMGNCLENALEACLKIPPQERKISIRIKQIEERVIMVFENTFDGQFKIENNQYYSCKLKFKKTGIGLSSVSAIVKKYDGSLHIEQKKGLFSVSLLLQN